MIALVVISDGRADYLARTIESANENLIGDIGHKSIVNDSGDLDYRDWLRRNYSDWALLHHQGRQGLAQAVGTAWEWAGTTDADHLFHLEEDFTFNAPLNLTKMAWCLNAHPELAQLVLKRQPWSPEEINAGGQMELSPDEYTDRHSNLEDWDWVEHRRLFSFNPSLIPRKVFGQEWGPVLEADVTARLFADPETRSTYWGRRDDPPRCHHIGVQRSVGYRW